MTQLRPIHSDFQKVLDFKEAELIALFSDLRNHILDLYPEANELLYHTHALTAVFSTSEKLGDAFCHIPIYSNHLNLGFNKGTLLNDPHQLLAGTGKLIRHLSVEKATDYRNPTVKSLMEQAIALSLEDQDMPSGSKGKTISKIKEK